MNQADVHQELEGSIDRGRRGFLSFTGQPCKDVVGADGFMAVPNQFQDPFSDRRETSVLLVADGLGIRQSLRNALAMIVFS